MKLKRLKKFKYHPKKIRASQALKELKSANFSHKIIRGTYVGKRWENFD